MTHVFSLGLRLGVMEGSNLRENMGIIIGGLGCYRRNLETNGKVLTTWKPFCYVNSYLKIIKIIIL